MHTDQQRINSIKNKLEQLKENVHVELKTAKNALPKDFWPTFSAFSNTHGGTIFLGIEEGSPKNKLTGVNNYKKIIDDLFSTLSNKNKVSYSNISDDDVDYFTIDGATIIMVNIKEADNKYKPVHLNGQYEFTYIRKHSGDVKVSDEELRIMLRNSNPVYDTLFVDDFGIEALDPISIASYKEKVSSRYQSYEFDKLSHQEFLQRINAAEIVNGKFKIKKGTLLFFGKYTYIKKEFPQFFLDYINKSTEERRWIDRISSDDLVSVEMNIYNFFNMVFDKLRGILVNKFDLNEESLRIQSPSFDIAIRESLTNCLAHADYAQGFPSIKIEALPGMFVFRNPGQMLIPIEKFILGGDSRPRNEIIMSLFRYLGLSERQGEGGPSIFQNAIDNEYREPQINTNLESTTLTLWHVNLLESHPELTPDEKEVFIYLNKHGLSKSKELQSALGMTEYKVRKSINSLKEKELVTSLGDGRSTKYTISNPRHIITLMQSTLNQFRQELH